MKELLVYSAIETMLDRVIDGDGWLESLVEATIADVDCEETPGWLEFGRSRRLQLLRGCSEYIIVDGSSDSLSTRVVAKPRNDCLG